ncbi:Protein of unknown function [Cotesia congregata]|uniref:Uncharacterized protein n=1 Tax=Cotesia congregata TaxID=51543 RepID=A0A8J2MKN7_COTCN|nr:Protein of unknown function [Cotesia congregata]
MYKACKIPMKIHFRGGYFLPSLPVSDYVFTWLFSVVLVFTQFGLQFQNSQTFVGSLAVFHYLPSLVSMSQKQVENLGISWEFFQSRIN